MTENMRFLVKEFLPTVTKNQLTRTIKQQKSYLKDVEDAWEDRHRHGGMHGWLHGDKIWYRNVNQEKEQLRVMEEFRAKM